MGEAANGKDAMDQIEKLQPQIVISDVVMPLMDGVDFTVAGTSPLSAHPDDHSQWIR